MQAKGSEGVGRTLIKTKTPGIYQRGERYVVRFRDPSGKQRQRSARTLAEARRLRSELSADVSRGEYRPDTKVTFATYAETWATSYTGRTSRGLRPETMRDYVRDLGRAVAYLGRRRLAEVGPADVKGYARHLSESGLSPVTVRRYLAPVKVLFATAVEDGLVRYNPTAGVRLGGSLASEPEHARVKALAPDELAALVEESPEGPRRLLVVLLANTGLRVSEVLGLRWASLDVSARRLAVSERIREGKIGAPKSRNGTREVPLSSALACELAAHRLASSFSTESDFIFPSATGKPQSAANLYGWFKLAAGRAGVPWAGFHALRHTAASRWLLGGVTIAQVARLLGHHDASFTLRTYISVLPSDLPDGDALARAVGLG
jgi:integrase